MEVKQLRDRIMLIGRTSIEDAEKVLEDTGFTENDFVSLRQSAVRRGLYAAVFVFGSNVRVNPNRCGTGR
jgi:hypothetical protein